MNEKGFHAHRPPGHGTGCRCRARASGVMFEMLPDEEAFALCQWAREDVCLPALERRCDRVACVLSDCVCFAVRTGRCVHCGGPAVVKSRTLETAGEGVLG